MAFLEVTTGSKASKVTISFRSIANITYFIIPAITFLTTNTQPERLILFDLNIDGTTYSISFEIEDESYHSRDFLGRLKRLPSKEPTRPRENE